MCRVWGDLHARMEEIFIIIIIVMIIIVPFSFNHLKQGITVDLLPHTPPCFYSSPEQTNQPLDSRAGLLHFMFLEAAFSHRQVTERVEEGC